MLGSKIAARLAGVTKRYGDIVAIDLLNLEVKCGEAFGLLGPKGSEKCFSVGRGKSGS